MNVERTSRKTRMVETFGMKSHENMNYSRLSFHNADLHFSQEYFQLKLRFDLVKSGKQDMSETCY